jgi:hypothetical protein
LASEPQRGLLTGDPVAPSQAGGLFRLRFVVMMGVVMMRFVMDAMMVVTRMVFIAPPRVPRAAGLCRRKRGSENDHNECNFQVHDVFFPFVV